MRLVETSQTDLAFEPLGDGGLASQDRMPCPDSSGDSNLRERVARVRAELARRPEVCPVEAEAVNWSQWWNYWANG